jgi:hypothetical protein
LVASIEPAYYFTLQETLPKLRRLVKDLLLTFCKTTSETIKVNKSHSTHWNVDISGGGKSLDFSDKDNDEKNKWIALSQIGCESDL